MIRIGVITGYPTDDASSRAIIEAAARVGEAVPLDPTAFSARVDSGRVRLSADGEPIDRFDLFLLLRGVGPDGEPDLQFDLYRALECQATVLNRVDALLAAQDKFRTSLQLARAGVATPEVRVLQRAGDVQLALRELECAVAKPIWGSLGEGIERLDDGDQGRARGERLVQEQGALYLQRFVEHGGRDVRAFVVGDRVAAAIERFAPPGDFRTNVSIGGEPRAIDLSREAEELAVRAARVLGLDWAGVDLAFGADGPTVIEVNGSPNWEGILRATGHDMAQAIVAHALRRVMATASRRTASIEGMGG